MHRPHHFCHETIKPRALGVNKAYWNAALSLEVWIDFPDSSHLKVLNDIDGFKQLVLECYKRYVLLSLVGEYIANSMNACDTATRRRDEIISS